MQDFVVLVDVGPKDSHLAELTEVLESLFYFEPEVQGVIIINDSTDSDRLNPLKETYPNKLLIVNSPWDLRLSRGVWGRACARTLLGLKLAYETYAPFSYLVKIDTDSFIINRFSHRISAFFAKHPSVGIVGTCKREPNGNLRNLSIWPQTISRYARKVTWFDLRKFSVYCFKFFRQNQDFLSQISDTIQGAIKNGYKPAENCQGGGYAVSYALIQSLYEKGQLNHPELWLYLYLGEDLLMGILAKYCNFNLADFNHDGEPFGVQYKGLSFAPEELVKRGYAIIHSTKATRGWSQAEIIRMLKSFRNSNKPTMQHVP